MKIAMVFRNGQFAFLMVMRNFTMGRLLLVLLGQYKLALAYIYAYKGMLDMVSVTKFDISFSKGGPMTTYAGTEIPAGIQLDIEELSFLDGVVTVGVCKLNSVYRWLESFWFQPFKRK